MLTMEYIGDEFNLSSDLQLINEEIDLQPEENVSPQVKVKMYKEMNEALEMEVTKLKERKAALARLEIKRIKSLYNIESQYEDVQVEYNKELHKKHSELEYIAKLNMEKNNLQVETAEQAERIFELKLLLKERRLEKTVKQIETSNTASIERENVKLKLELRQLEKQLEMTETLIEQDKQNIIEIKKDVLEASVAREEAEDYEEYVNVPVECYGCVNNSSFWQELSESNELDSFNQNVINMVSKEVQTSPPVSNKQLFLLSMLHTPDAKINSNEIKRAAIPKIRSQLKRVKAAEKLLIRKEEEVELLKQPIASKSGENNTCEFDVKKISTKIKSERIKSEYTKLAANASEQGCFEEFDAQIEEGKTVFPTSIKKEISQKSRRDHEANLTQFPDDNLKRIQTGTFNEPRRPFRCIENIPTQI